METVYWTYAPRIQRLVHMGFRGADGKIVPGVGYAELEDLVQEIFARAFSERARLAYDGQRDYGPYLSILACNVVVEWARKRKREIHFEETDLDAPSEVSSSGERDLWEDIETNRIVQAYVATLPTELALVHRGRYVLGHSQEAAAAALGLSRQQLRTREARLREGLDRALRGGPSHRDLAEPRDRVRRIS